MAPRQDGQPADSIFDTAWPFHGAHGCTRSNSKQMGAESKIMMTGRPTPNVHIGMLEDNAWQEEDMFGLHTGDTTDAGTKS